MTTPESNADAAREALAALRAEVAKAVVGQDPVVTGLVIALLCRGHVLLEGVPGVAKTLLVRTLSATLALDFKRVQFTPDLMPGDVTGSLVYDARTAEFEFREGPVFTNLLLADEINRTPPKTQAALLEAMEERQVSVEGSARALPDPFIVVATQNPVEYEGTYQLPEAQLDRFQLKLTVPLPPREQEIAVLEPWGKLDIPGSGGHGKARYDAMLLIADAYGCTRAFYGVGMSPKDPWGGFELRYGGPASLVEQVAEVLPGFLEEIEEAAKAATKAYGEHLRTLPEEDHDPKWRPSMRRKFRRDFMVAYARHLSWRILTGDRQRRAPIQPRPDSAHGLAELAASRSDLRGCLPTAHGYIPRAVEGRRQIHAPDYIRTITTEESPR